MAELIDQINLKQANVYGVYGNLGGGKSLTCVYLALQFLRRGFPVDSNIELFLPEHLIPRYRFIEDISTFDPWSFQVGAPRGTPDPLRSCVIVDECAEFFDQYSGNSPVIRQFLSWLRHSSKRGQFVFLIVQQPEFLQKALRLLVRNWIRVEDLGVSRVPIIKMTVPFLSGFVLARVFDRMGNLISRGVVLVSKREYGRYYDTAQSIATRGRAYSYTRPDNDTPSSDVLFWLLVICILATIL